MDLLHLRRALPGLVLVLAALSPAPGTAEISAVLHGAEAVGEDLVVTLSWGAHAEAGTAAELSLAGAAGEVVASVETPAAPGSLLEVALAGALGRLQQHGLGYRLSLAGAGGEPLAAPRAVRVAFACSSRKSCAPVVLVGYEVSAGALVSESLADALAALRSERTQDVLARLERDRPDLLGEILTFSRQLSDLTADEEPGRCLCAWTLAVARDPDTSWGEWEPVPRPQAAHAGEVGPGPFHALGAQSVAGRAGMSGLGESRVTAGLECWELLRRRPVAVTVGSRELTWEEPVLAFCERLCETEVEHRVEAWIRLETQAEGSAFGGSSAAAKEMLTAVADGSVFFSETLAESSSVPAGGAEWIRGSRQRAASVLRKAPSTLIFSSQGEVDVYASPAWEELAQPYAFADLVLEYSIRSRATSECASASAILTDEKLVRCPVGQRCGGGIRIVRWKPPPK